MLIRYLHKQLRRGLGIPELQAELSNLVATARASSAAQGKREIRTTIWAKETAKQIALIRETIAASSLEDDNLFRTLEALRTEDGPIIVGPWLSEVGFELLYWIPFLQWFVKEFAISRSRVVAISRGGVASWYANVAERYYEIFDHYSVDDFRSANELRMSQSGSIKQSRSFDFDQALLEFATRKLQLTGARILHPSVMYSYFQPYWAGIKSQRDVLSRLRFLRLPPVTDPIVDRLPDKFVAAKFYNRPGSGMAPQDAASLRRFVSRTALITPVVSLDSRLAVDEHDAYGLDGISNTIRVGAWLEPGSNLRVQTAIVSKADALIGTYGGFTYLPILLGKPSIGVVLGRDHLLNVHGNIMYSMVEALDGSISILPACMLDVSSALLPASRHSGHSEWIKGGPP